MQASGLWETAETELRANNREVRVFTKDEAHDIAEACLPITPQHPKAKMPRTTEEYRKRWIDHLTKASAENKRKGLEYLLYLKTNYMGSVEHYEQFQKLLIELVVTYKG